MKMFRSSIRFISFNNLHYKCKSFYTVQNLFTKNLNTSDVRVRFAPSPTGNLHFGGVRTALFNFAFAKSHPNGKFIIRIEDTDQARLVPGVSKKIEEILNWMKLTPDESPTLGGNYGPYIQSERLPIYKEKAHELIKNGHAYKCFCSDIRLKLLRKEQMKNKERSRYDGACRNLSQKEIETLENDKIPYTVRLKFSDVGSFDDMVFGESSFNQSDIEGDFIILKSDGFPTYNFANVIDDHLMNITHVLRGEEMRVSTPKHLLLYSMFGWTPPIYGHLPLLKGPDGIKLSKRHGASDIDMYKNSGYFPEALLNLISYSGGAFQKQNYEFHSFYLQELIDRFNISHMKTNNAILEPKHLDIFGRNFLLRKIKENPTVVVNECKDVLKTKYNPTGIDQLDDEYILKILEWDELNISRYSDLLTPNLEYLWTDTIIGKSSIKQKDNLIKDIVLLLEAEVQTDLREEFENIRKLNELNKKQFYGLLRKLLTGNEIGPPLFSLIDLIGYERTIKKMKRL